MSKDIDIKVTGSGFLHPSDPKIGLDLPIHSTDQLRSMTKALNDGLPWNVARRMEQAAKLKKK